MLVRALFALRRALEIGDVHKCMRESHFAAIDNAIAHAFYEGEDVVISGIEHDLVERCFESL